MCSSDLLLRNDDRMAPQAIPAMDVRAPAASREERLRRAMERGLAAYQVDWPRWTRGAPEGDRLRQLLLAIEPAHEIPATATGAERVKRLAGDPVFQLK